MKRISALIAVLAAVAAIGFAVSASAADSPSLVDDVAARLGTTPEKLRAAFRDALTARIDAAVKSGKLTEEQGDKLKKRIADGKGFGFGLRLRAKLGWHHKPFAPRLRAGLDRLAPVATYLGITSQQLRTELREGKSLAEIAAAHGKSVDGLVDALVERAKKGLDAAVEHGRLTRERADKILERLKDGAEKLVQHKRPSTK